MSNCGHGHVYPRSDGAKARCGGPSICRLCALDVALLLDDVVQSLHMLNKVLAATDDQISESCVAAPATAKPPNQQPKE